MVRADLIVIEPAREGDLKGILKLLAVHKLPPEGLATHLSTTLVARRGDELVGCSALEIYEGGALLRSVAVHPDVQGLGLGEQLVLSCLDMAQQRRLSVVFLLTETAEGYFGRFGFVPVDRGRVPPSVLGSLEFTTACPAEAQAMAFSFPHESSEN